MVNVYDPKEKKMVQLYDLIPLKIKIGYAGEIRYRLSGVTKDGRKLNKYVDKNVALRFGSPRTIFIKNNKIDIEEATEKRCKKIRLSRENKKKQTELRAKMNKTKRLKNSRI